MLPTWSILFSEIAAEDLGNEDLEKLKSFQVLKRFKNFQIETGFQQCLSGRNYKLTPHKLVTLKNVSKLQDIHIFWV